MPRKKPYFSIIMPVYNVETYLDAAIKSILGQTFRNFELILVDDGSTDSSGRIAAGYRDRDRRIVLVRQPNAGLSAARNIGLAHARGTYVYCIDSDDMLERTALKTIYELLSENNHPEVLAFSASPFLDQGGEVENSEVILQNYRDTYERNYLIDGLYSGIELYREMATRHNFVPNAYLFVIKLVFLKTINLKFVDGIIFEDEVFSRHLFTSADKIFFTNKKLYRRRIRSGSIMQSQVSRQKVLSLAVLAEEIHALYRKRNIPELKDDALRFFNDAVRFQREHFPADPEIAGRLVASSLFLPNLQKITPTGQDFEMHVPLPEASRYADGTYQPLTARIISSYILDDSLFFDLGAGYGYFSLIAASRAQAKKVVAVEPGLFAFEILSGNAGLNAFKNLAIYSLSFSEDEEGNAVEFLRPFDDGVSNLFFKINADGREAAVLQGLKSWIEHANPRVRLVIEYAPQKMEKTGFAPQELLKMLFAFGFDVFVIDEATQVVCKIEAGRPVGAAESAPGPRKNADIRLLCLPKNSPSSVLFFSHSSSLAGSEKSLQALISGFPKAGIITTVVLPADGPFKQLLEKNGAMTVVSKYGWWSDREQVEPEESRARLARDFRHVQEELAPLIVRVNPDIIVTNTSVIPWGGACAFLTNKPHVWYVRELGLPEYGINYFYPHDKIAEYIKEGSNLIVTNSLFTRNSFFGESTRLRTEVVSPAVEMEEATDSESYFHQADGLKLACVGEIVPGKGQSDAIHALRELISAGKNVEIVLAGSLDAEYYKLLLDLVQEFSLAPFVHFVGFVKSPFSLYRQADAVVICSRNEAFGRVTLEAMQLGKPIIAAGSGGTLDLIEDEVNGLLYPPGNTAQLADRIKRLMDEPETRNRLGAKAAETARQKFTREASLTDFVRVLRSVSGEPNRSARTFSYWVRELENIVWQTRLAEKEAQKDAQLAQKDAQLAEIHSSRGWRLVLWLRKVRLLIAPLNSRRARAGQTALSILKRIMRK
jgi:FkbM family methyltransferase